MKKSSAVITLTAAFCFSIVPMELNAASAASPNSVTTGISNAQPGRGKRFKSRGEHYGWKKGRHVGWHKGRRAYWFFNDPGDRRYVRETYYYGGRPRARWIWYY